MHAGASTCTPVGPGAVHAACWVAARPLQLGHLTPAYNGKLIDGCLSRRVSATGSGGTLKIWQLPTAANGNKAPAQRLHRLTLQNLAGCLCGRQSCSTAGRWRLVSRIVPAADQQLNTTAPLRRLCRTLGWRTAHAAFPSQATCPAWRRHPCSSGGWASGRLGRGSTGQRHRRARRRREGVQAAVRTCLPGMWLAPGRIPLCSPREVRQAAVHARVTVAP